MAGAAAVLALSVWAWDVHAEADRARAVDDAYLRVLEPAGVGTPNDYNYTLRVEFGTTPPGHRVIPISITGMSFDGGWLGEPTAVVTDVTIGQEFPGVPLRDVPPFVLDRPRQVMELTFRPGAGCRAARSDPPGDLVLRVALPSGRTARVRVRLQGLRSVGVDWRVALRKELCPPPPPRLGPRRPERSGNRPAMAF